MKTSPRRKRDPSASPPQRGRLARQASKYPEDEDLEELIELLNMNIAQRKPENISKIHELITGHRFSKNFFSRLGDLPEENQLLICKFLKLEDMSSQDLILKEETSSNLRVYFILSGDVSIRVLRHREVSPQDTIVLMAGETIWQLYGWFRAIGWDRSTSERRLQEIWKSWMKEPIKMREKKSQNQGFELNKLTPVGGVPSRKSSFNDSPSFVQLQVSATPKAAPTTLSNLVIRPIGRRNMKGGAETSTSKRRSSQQSIVSDRSIKTGKTGFADLASITKTALDQMESVANSENTFVVSKKHIKTDLCFSKLNHYAPLESVVLQSELPASNGDKDSERSILVVEATVPDTQVTLLLGNLVNPFSLPDDLRQVYVAEFARVNPDIPSCSHSELSSYLRMKLYLLERIIRPFDAQSFEEMVECHMTWYLGKHVRTLYAGEVFGERALEGKNIRTASAYCKTDCR